MRNIVLVSVVAFALVGCSQVTGTPPLGLHSNGISRDGAFSLVYGYDNCPVAPKYAPTAGPCFPGVAVSGSAGGPGGGGADGAK